MSDKKKCENPCLCETCLSARDAEIGRIYENEKSLIQQAKQEAYDKAIKILKTKYQDEDKNSRYNRAVSNCVGEIVYLQEKWEEEK